MKSHPKRADSDIKTEWEKNYGDEKDNYAQDGTHCPQDGTKGGARYSQADDYITRAVSAASLVRLHGLTE